jgi:hypothetical protein
LANLSSVGSPDVNQRASADMAKRMKPRRQTAQAARPAENTGGQASPGFSSAGPQPQSPRMNPIQMAQAARQQGSMQRMQQDPEAMKRYADYMQSTGRGPQPPQGQAGWSPMPQRPGGYPSGGQAPPWGGAQAPASGPNWMNSTGQAPVRPSAPTYGQQAYQPRPRPMPVPQQFQGGGRPNAGGYGQMQQFNPNQQPRSPWGQPQQNPFSRRW